MTPTYPCALDSCTSEDPGTWAPVFLLRAVPNEEPARARLHLRLCDDCRDALTLDNLLNDENWRNVMKRWPARFALPTRALTELDWDLVDPEDDITE